MSWVPGGTELSSGRLGAIVPVAVGQALGLRAQHGAAAHVVCHCGDAGWVSGQALNGFIAASLHSAPLVFVMHRNGIQLSGPTAKIMDRDPRPVVSSLGIRVLEIPSLHDRTALFARLPRSASRSPRTGQPSLIYPTGFRSAGDCADHRADVRRDVRHRTDEVARFAATHTVCRSTPTIWIPGSLMSFRDAHAMLRVPVLRERPAGRRRRTTTAA